MLKSISTLLLFLLLLLPAPAQTILGKHPADQFVPQFFLQNSNADKLAAGMNAATVKVTNVDWSLNPGGVGTNTATDAATLGGYAPEDFVFQSDISGLSVSYADTAGSASADGGSADYATDAGTVNNMSAQDIIDSSSYDFASEAGYAPNASVGLADWASGADSADSLSDDGAGLGSVDAATVNGYSAQDIIDTCGGAWSGNISDFNNDVGYLTDVAGLSVSYADSAGSADYVVGISDHSVGELSDDGTYLTPTGDGSGLTGVVADMSGFDWSSVSISSLTDDIGIITDVSGASVDYANSAGDSGTVNGYSAQDIIDTCGGAWSGNISDFNNDVGYLTDVAGLSVSYADAAGYADSASYAENAGTVGGQSAQDIINAASGGGSGAYADLAGGLDDGTGTSCFSFLTGVAVFAGEGYRASFFSALNCYGSENFAAGTDYLAPDGDGSGLTGVVTDYATSANYDMNDRDLTALYGSDNFVSGTDYLAPDSDGSLLTGVVADMSGFDWSSVSISSLTDDIGYQDAEGVTAIVNDMAAELNVAHSDYSEYATQATSDSNGNQISMHYLPYAGNGGSLDLSENASYAPSMSVGVADSLAGSRLACGTNGVDYDAGKEAWISVGAESETGGNGGTTHIADGGRGTYPGTGGTVTLGLPAPGGAVGQVIAGLLTLTNGIKTVEGAIFYPHDDSGTLVWTTSP